MSAINVPPPKDERGIASSPFRYICGAASVAILAFTVANASLHLSVVFFLVSAWLLWSGLSVLLNRHFNRHFIQHLHSMTMEFNSAVWAGCLFPFTFPKLHHGPTKDFGGVPILMINGYLSFGATWGYAKRKLVAAKLGPVYTMNIGTGESIETYTEEVAEKIREIKSEKIILIGHSKGGLIALDYLTRLAKDHGCTVTHLITIGSPLNGTSIAKFGFSEDAIEMRPNSKFIQSLQKRLQTIKGTRILHIGSKTDYVVPEDSALCGNKDSLKLSFNDIGHIALVFSSRVATIVCQFIKNEF